MVEDRDVQLRAPLNWVISLCQGRISEFLDIMRVPTYLEHVKATEGYPPDLASNEHAAQLLTACLQGMKEQALDISLKEVWLNLHKGQVIPLQENGLAGATPTAAAPVPPPAAGGARAGRAAQPVVAPQVGHYGQPLGRPPRRRDTVEELRARNADLEARIHFLNHTDHGGGRNGNRTPTGGGMTGSPSGSYGGGRGSPAKRIRPGDARRDAEAACLTTRVANQHLCTDNLLFVCAGTDKDCHNRPRRGVNRGNQCPLRHVDGLAGNGITRTQVEAEWTACDLPNRICSQPKRALILAALT